MSSVDQRAKDCKEDPTKCGCRGSAAMCLRQWEEDNFYHPTCHHPIDTTTDNALKDIGKVLCDMGFIFVDYNIHSGLKTTTSVYRNPDIRSEDEILIITRKKGSRYYNKPG